MAVYKPYKKTASGKDEIKIPYSSIDGTPTIPTKVSELTNDSNYATTTQVNAKYTKPSTGIPKSDLASAVQTSLNKANTALQSIKTLTITSNGSVLGTFNGTSDITIDIPVSSATAASYNDIY